MKAKTYHSGDIVWSPSGHPLGTVHEARSGRWYVKVGGLCSASRWITGQAAAEALMRGDWR